MRKSAVREPMIAIACLATVTLASCDADSLDLQSEDPVASDTLASTSPNDNQLDETFGGGDGIKRAYSNRALLAPHAVSVTSDHRVLFTTKLGNGNDEAGVFVGRLTAAGDEDPAWANGTYAWLTIAADAQPGGVQQLGNSIFVSGARNKKPFLARLSNAGVVDVDFGNFAGLKLYDTPWSFDQAGFFNLTRTADGHLVASGWGKSGHTEYLLVARLEAANGAPDTGFGTNGFARVPVGEFGAELGGWVAVGKGRNDVFTCMIAGRQVFHFDEDGHRDTGYDGITEAGCDALAVSGQGIAYVAGEWKDDHGRHLGGVVEALDGRGQPLAHFGGTKPPGANFDTDGMTFTTSSSQGFRPASIEYSDDLERIYVVGRGVSGGESRTLAVALRADGRRDDTFGGEGLVTANIGASDLELPVDSVLDGERLVALAVMQNTSGDAPKGAGVIRWAIDAGGTGEPCKRAHACIGEGICTAAHPHTLVVRTCEAPDDGDPSSPPPAPDVTTICANETVPAGFVKFDDSHSGSRCGSPPQLDNYNVWSVRRYTGVPSGGTLSVCSDATVPSGWSIVGYEWSATRCGHYQSRTNNVMTIRSP
jgi:hypothetical protein